MKKFICILMSVLVMMLTFAACGDNATLTSDKDNSADRTTANEEITKTTELTMLAEPYGIHHVEIKVKNYGTIAVELDGDSAPVTVENFINLAKDGFYDGLTFHRIFPDFMIQGGDPNGNGTGGADKDIQGEFKSNGVKNEIHHKRGVISMARSDNPNSASSQFFICQKDENVAHLDGDYAAFGYVTSGMDIVDKIVDDARPIDNNGTILADEQPIIETIKVID